jgi:dTDP-glucose 4,6-dehydratase
MNFLVTGCFGFIGYNFIKKINEEYPEILIIGLDSLQNNCSIINKEQYKNAPNFKFIKSDINEINSQNINKIDTIINFAAESHVDNSIYNPELFIDSNVKGVAALLKYAIKNEIPNFIHISTDEVYGSIKDGFFKESDNFNPSSPYSASKASAELLINSYKKTYGYDVTILRPANNYGAYQQPEKLIPFSIAKLNQNENIEIYGKGDNVRHWLSVDDTNRAILKIINSKKRNEVFNIGSEYYLSNINLAKKLLSILNLDEGRINFVEDRPGHDFRYATNIDKLKKIGWKPESDFDYELEKTVNWYLDNKNWWFSQFENIISHKRDKRLGIT